MKNQFDQQNAFFIYFFFNFPILYYFFNAVDFLLNEPKWEKCVQNHFVYNKYFIQCSGKWREL